MKIIRNGQEFELTFSEFIQAHEEYELDCMIEDVKSQYEQGEYDVELSDEQIREVASCALRTLNRNDSYFEAYWMSVEYTLDDYINNLHAEEKEELKENLNREIKEFRQSFENMKPEEVYESFYKINFYEEYYALLTSDFIDNYEQLVEWLSVHSYPLAFLYDEWLRCDGAFSCDWGDMVDFMVNLMDYEEECTKEEN